jgi:TP901 family phage tail tape measure protein
MSKFVLTAQLQLQAPNNVKQVVQQIQSQLNGVSVNVQVQNAAQAQKQIQQVAQATNQATTAAERMGKAFALSIRRFAAFSIATRAVGLFTSTLSEAVQTSIDFERQLIKVSQVTGKSIGQLRGLTKQITDLSTGFGVASSDLLNVSTILAQAGLSAEETSVALKTLAKSALAPNFDNITETAEGAIAVLAQFGEGVGALEKQLGSINAVAGAFAVEAGDLIDVIRRTGGVFKASGGDLNELLALFTSVRATTRESAESIGTGLRTIFTRIQRPKTIEFLKEFGVELVDLNGKFVGPYEAIKRLSEALSGLGEGDTTFIRVAEELGGFRQIGKVLPLLQQFSTAQSALNVAMKAGDSLTQDAASAQAALAVRIMKVKEEFLALIRSVTETTTFQVMANTALSLASALIKIGDSIKPLLPMLAALSAFKLVKGMSGFFGGMMSGATSGRAYNSGGKVLGFARGGLVPGSGNRDTVPAMLSPGEFVIRKSSVNKMGAGTLAAMNENRYNTGRKVVGTTKTGLKGSQEKRDPLSQRVTKKATTGSSTVEFDVNPNAIGAFVLQPAKGTDGYYKAQNPESFTLPANSRYAQLFAKQNGLTTQDLGAGVKAQINPTNYPVFYPGLSDRSDLSKTAEYQKAVSKGVRDAIITGVNSTIQSVSSSKLLDIPPVFDTNENLMQGTISKILSDQQVTSSIEGYMFESMISAFTGASAAGGRSNFDFAKSAISNNKTKLKVLFGNNPIMDSLVKAEAKRSYGEVGGNIQRKLANDIIEGNKAGVTLKTSGQRQKKYFGGIIQKFAAGGGVGTDTVPALLTPGEFVVNRSSAQRIGYGNLSRMNKVGKYAKGGVVQHFATGTSGTGAKSVISDFNIPGFDTKAPTMLNNIIGKLTGTFSVTDATIDNANKQFKVLKATVPDLSRSLVDYGNANDLSKKEMSQLAVAYSKLVIQILRQGASSAEIVARMQPFKNALDAGAKGISATASTATAASSSSTPFTPSGSGGGPPPTNVPPTTSKVTTAGGAGGNMGGLFNDFGANVAAVSAALSTMLPPLDENSGALTKIAHNFLSLTTTIGGVAFALGQFGIQLKAANIASFAKSLTTMGKGGLGEKIGGFTRQNGQTTRAAGESITESFRSARNTPIKKSFLDRKLSQAREESFQTLGPNTRGQPLFAQQRSDMAKKLLDLRKARSNIAMPTPTSLTGKLGNFLGQTASRGGFAGRLAGMAGQGITKVGGMLGGISGGAVGGAAATAAAAAGPALAVTGAVAAINNVIGSFRDLDDKLKHSIETGKVEEASRLAVAQKASEFPLIGNIVSSVFGEAGDEILLGAGELFGGPSLESVKQLAAAQAGAARTSKALEEAQRTAADAMNDFKNGAITAEEALARIRNKTGEASNQQKRSSSFVATNLQQRGGLSRDIFTLGGLLGETSTERNKRLGGQNVEQINQSSKFMQEAFNIESEARQSAIRSGVTRGKNPDDIRETAMGNLRSQREQALKTAKVAAASGDTVTYDAAIAQAEQLRQNMEQVDKEIQNIEKEVKKAKDAFEAMNLGLRSAEATASAMSATMDRFSAGLEVGGSTLVADVEFLQQSMSSAAQAMNPDDIKNAMKNVSDSLSSMGVSDTHVKKFEGNVNAFTQAQTGYTQAFENVKKSMAGKDFKNLSADEFKKKMADELVKGMDGVPDAAKKNFKKAFGSMDLNDDEINKIIGGDLSVLGEKMSESQKKMFEPVMKIMQERAKAEQVLIEFTKKRIDAERNLVQAQQEALDLTMEGREIQSKYGGAAVTAQEKRSNLLAKSNVESNRLGLSSMRTGDAGELRRRNSEIMAGFSNIEARRGQQGGMSGKSGVEADEAQKDLQKAYKTQIETIRGLIKLEEEQLKITQEKNKLEKDSMESLVKGDIEEFFKKQSAVGATAAIASGDTRLQNLYGADALGIAYQDIQRQQEAGVQTLYGQQLAGAGGLTEAAAGAALSSRGITDMRAAQVMAGTTAEEEASKARLRELGGMLGETGQIGAEMAEMQVQTATINVNTADLKFKEVEARGKAAAEKANAAENMPAIAKARGGLIYASRGIFVPRGTDTIPAMLTPGEFVVNRAAVQHGNNLQILRAMNNGLGSVSNGGGAALMASGGIVRYRGDGSNKPEAPASGNGGNMFENMSKFVTAISNFNSDLSTNIDKLTNNKISIKLDTTNVNVNLNDGGLLKKLTDEVQMTILALIPESFRVVEGGRLKRDSGVK